MPLLNIGSSRDRGFSYKEELFETMPYGHGRYENPGNSLTLNKTTDPNSFMNEGDELGGFGSSTSTMEPDPAGDVILRNICSGNLIYVHVIPSSLHFLSFIYMLYLYWLNHDEQLQNLMERVFIQATQAHSTFFSPKKVVRTLKVLVMFGCSWLILSTVCIVLQVYHHRIVINFWESTGIVERKTMGSVMGFSTLWQDAIQVTVIISYCIHCHLLSTYLDFLHSRISHHSINLAECIKELGEIDKLLQYINNELANGLLPLLLLDATFFITSLTYLLTHGPKLPIHDFLIQALISSLWLSLLTMPLVQAARLSTGLKKVRELGHLVRMRPFGYQQYQQCDLDSFLLFVSTIKMEQLQYKIPAEEIVKMPELYDGVPEFSQWTKAIIPAEWLALIWPRYSIFSYRSMERGFGGHPILLPQTLWPFPRRDVPMFYWNFSLDSSAFFVGACAGLYVGFRNSYIQRDLNLLLAKHIFFDFDGLEVGGTKWDWLEWTIKDRRKIVTLVRRTICWALGGGVLHCFSCYWYRILAQSTGHMIPMLFTCFVMTIGDLEFMTNYRTIGNACYMAVAYDFLRQHFLGGNSTFYGFHYAKKYFGDPLNIIIWPPRWFGLSAINPSNAPLFG